MIKYIVHQSGVYSIITRECSYLTVMDGDGKQYNIRTDRRGELEVTAVGDDLKVVAKSSNSLTVGTDE